MKKTLLTLMTLSFGFAAMAQHFVQVKSGVNISSFTFKDSKEVRQSKDYTHVFNNYSAVSYESHLGKGERHILRPEIGFRQSGSKMIEDGRKYEWKFNYLDVNLSYMFKFLGNDKYGLHVGAGPNLAFLLNGEQTLPLGQTGVQYSNVIKDKTIKILDFGVNFLANAQFKVTENFFVTFEYRYGLGILDIESDSNKPTQHTRSTNHFVLAGLMFNLNAKSKKDQEQEKLKGDENEIK